MDIQKSPASKADVLSVMSEPESGVKSAKLLSIYTVGMISIRNKVMEKESLHMDSLLYFI